MNPQDELHLRDLIDAVTKSTVHQLHTEHALRSLIRQTSETMDDAQRLKLSTMLTHYAYDRLCMSKLPDIARISFEKTQKYFDHQFKIADWQCRRSDLMMEWTDLDDEFEELNEDRPNLIDDIEDEDIPEFETKQPIKGVAGAGGVGKIKPSS